MPRHATNGSVFTSERLYSEAELEYLQAVDKFKARTGKKFLTNSEYLAIALALGYTKPPALPPGANT